MVSSVVTFGFFVYFWTELLDFVLGCLVGFLLSQSGFLHLRPSSCHVILKSTQCCWTRYWNANRFLKMYIEISLTDQNISIAENGIKSISALCTCVLHMDISIIFQLCSLYNWMSAFIFLAPLDWNGGTALHLSVPMVKVWRCPLMSFSPITKICALLMVSWLNMLISFYVIQFFPFPPLAELIHSAT